MNKKVIIVCIVIVLVALAIGIITKSKREQRIEESNEKVKSVMETKKEELLEVLNNQEYDLVVFLKPNVSKEKDINEAREKVTNIDGVETVAAYTKKDGLKKMKEIFEKQVEIMEEIKSREKNFTASFSIKIKDVKNYENIISQIQNVEVNGNKVIDKVLTREKLGLSTMEDLKDYSEEDIDSIMDLYRVNTEK